MKTLHESLHFNQQSWLMTARQLQRLRSDWQDICLKLGFLQFDQCHLSWNQPQLSIKCSAALATRLRQALPEIQEQLTLKGWGEVKLDCVVEKSANALSKTWTQQFALQKPVNELRFGLRTRPNPEQAQALQQIKRRLLNIKRNTNN